MTEPDEAGFKPGDRVDVFEVPGGYVVAATGLIDEEVARHIADAAAPSPDYQQDWKP